MTKIEITYPKLFKKICDEIYPEYDNIVSIQFGGNSSLFKGNDLVIYSKDGILAITPIEEINDYIFNDGSVLHFDILYEIEKNYDT
jgi:hypothetical protein